MEDIVKTIATAPGLPTDVASMVASMLAPALESYKDQRHAFQTTVVTMAAECLSAVESAMVAKEQALQKQIAEGPTEKIRREAALSAAAAPADAARDGAKAKKVELVEKTAAEKVAQIALKDALAKQKESEKGKEAIEATMKKLEDAKAKIDAAAGDKKAAVAAVKALKAFGFEDSLLNTAPTAIAKNVEDRGSFDILVAQQLADALAAKVQAHGDSLAAGQSGWEELAATVQAAQLVLDTAKAEHQGAITANQEASAHHKASDEALILAKRAVASHDADLRQAALELDSTTSGLASFRSAVLAVFVELCDKTSPLPEPGTTESKVVDVAVESGHAVAEPATSVMEA